MKRYTYSIQQTVNSMQLLNKLRTIVFNKWGVAVVWIAVYGDDTTFTYSLSIESGSRINKSVLYGINAYIAGAIALYRTY